MSTFHPHSLKKLARRLAGQTIRRGFSERDLVESAGASKIELDSFTEADWKLYWKTYRGEISNLVALSDHQGIDIRNEAAAQRGMRIAFDHTDQGVKTYG